MVNEVPEMGDRPAIEVVASGSGSPYYGMERRVPFFLDTTDRSQEALGVDLTSEIPWIYGRFAIDGNMEGCYT